MLATKHATLPRPSPNHVKAAAYITLKMADVTVTTNTAEGQFSQSVRRIKIVARNDGEVSYR
jgi:hypothetical protein